MAAVLIAVVAACGSPAASPSPSATQSAALVASPTAMPTPTPAPASPSPTQAGRYVNPVLGYTVMLSPPWRVSECLSTFWPGDPRFIGHDGITWRSSTEEQSLGASGGTGFTGAYAWIILIEAEVSSQTAAEYGTARTGAIGGQLQMTTIDGKPAARLNDGAGDAQAYYVGNAGRMYAITLTQGFDTRPRRSRTPRSTRSRARSRS